MSEYSNSAESGLEELAAKMNTYVLSGEVPKLDDLRELVELPHHKARLLISEMGRLGLKLRASGEPSEVLERYSRLSRGISAQQPSSYDGHSLNSGAGDGVFAIDRTAKTAGLKKFY